MKPRLMLYRSERTGLWIWYGAGIGDLGSTRALSVERAVVTYLALWTRRQEALA